MLPLSYSLSSANDIYLDRAKNATHSKEYNVAEGLATDLHTPKVFAEFRVRLRTFIFPQSPFP